MTEGSTDIAVALQTWREADARAQAAEAALAAAWEVFDRRAGNPPSEQLIQEVSRLRALANNKLTVLLMSMRSNR